MCVCVGVCVGVCIEVTLLLRVCWLGWLVGGFDTGTDWYEAGQGCLGCGLALLRNEAVEENEGADAKRRNAFTRTNGTALSLLLFRFFWGGGGRKVCSFTKVVAHTRTHVLTFLIDLSPQASLAHLRVLACLPATMPPMPPKKNTAASAAAPSPESAATQKVDGNKNNKSTNKNNKKGPWPGTSPENGDHPVVMSSGVAFTPSAWQGKYWRIGNRFYDLTPFLDRHPGGRALLEMARDRFDDSTYAFEAHHHNQVSSTPQRCF